MAIKLENVGIAVRDPDATETEPTRPIEKGMHRVAFLVDDLDEALVIAARGTTANRCAA